MNDELAAQTRYGRWLAWGTRLGLVLLAFTFLAYVAGLFAPHVPIDRMPTLWGQSASAFLEQAGIRPGWGWVRLLEHSDMMALAAIALLASCSIPCLAAIIPVFSRRREKIFVVICLLQIAVLAFAASGILSGAH